MADIQNIIKKVGTFFKPGEARKGMTPNEKELEFFREKKRQEDITKELKGFRDVENRKVLLGDNSLFQSEHGFDGKDIFKAKNQFNVQPKHIPKIMGSETSFMKGKGESLIKGKNVFFR